MLGTLLGFASNQMKWIRRTPDFKPAGFAFTVFALIWATLLLYAGAYTTSIGAGMVFLDWPLSNASINPEGWLQDVDMRAEHSHRLLGAKLGMLAILLVIYTQLRESRRQVRWLAGILLAAVIAQGLLGGLRVLFDQLNIGTEHNLIAQTFAVLHACGAQLTVGLLVTLAVCHSRFWIERNAGLRHPVSSSLRFWGITAVCVLFIQIALGAVMRHAGAGLAIPTFPLTPEGGVFPAIWNFPVTIHWLHRLGAVIASLVLLIFLCKIWGSAATRQHWRTPVVITLFLLALQIGLGAATIWTVREPVTASLHMLVGAFLLASTWMLALFTLKNPVLSDQTACRSASKAASAGLAPHSIQA